MPEVAQTMHGWAMPDHSLAPQLIRRFAVASPIAEILLRDIPQHFQHLGIRIVAQASNTAVTQSIYLDINPDSGVSPSGMQYSQLRVVSGSTVAATGSASSPPAPVAFGVIVGSNASNGVTSPGVLEGMIYCYSSPHWRYKSWMTRAWAPAQTGTFEQYFYGGRVDLGLVNRAITSLRITTDASSLFLANSLFELIGHP
jgi:hypothetical protein